MKRSLTLALFLAGTFGLPASTFAACVEENEKVEIEKSGGSLKSYICTVGGKKIRIKFHVLSNVAAGMLLGVTPLSASLKQALGEPKLVPNEISDLYQSVFRKFAKSVAINTGDGEADSGWYLSMMIGQADTATSWNDRVGGNSVKILVEPGTGPGYPMIDEWSFLKDKIIPPGLKFYFIQGCADVDCEKKTAGMTFWRGLTIDDIKKYPERVNALNAAIESGALKSDIGSHDPYLEFLQDVAPQGLPADFIILDMTFSGTLDICAEEDSWVFSYTPRDMTLAVVQVTNLSKESIALDGLFGDYQSLTGLHPITTTTGAGDLIEISAQTLPPKESAVVALRIEFPAPETNPDKEAIKEANQVSNAYYKKLGSNGFETNGDAYGIPDQRDYAYGPEIALSAVQIDGQRVDLKRRSTNFVEVIASTEAGSCPYLLSWDGTIQNWLDHGKVLHKAKGRQSEASDHTWFPGFQSRFRLEERESELASINQARLILSLKSGKIVRLKPDRISLRAHDADYLQLYWGDAAEFEFKLPDSVAVDDVETSKLELIGFYQRYSELPLIGEMFQTVPSRQAFARPNEFISNTP